MELRTQNGVLSEQRHFAARTPAPLWTTGTAFPPVFSSIFLTKSGMTRPPLLCLTTGLSPAIRGGFDSHESTVAGIFCPQESHKRQNGSTSEVSNRWKSFCCLQQHRTSPSTAQWT